MQLCKVAMKGKRVCGKENRTGCQVMNLMVRSVHEVALYIMIHIRCDVLTSRTLISSIPLVLGVQVF